MRTPISDTASLEIDPTSEQRRARLLDHLAELGVLSRRMVGRSTTYRLVRPAEDHLVSGAPPGAVGTPVERQWARQAGLRAAVGVITVVLAADIALALMGWWFSLPWSVVVLGVLLSVAVVAPRVAVVATALMASRRFDEWAPRAAGVLTGLAGAGVAAWVLRVNPESGWSWPTETTGLIAGFSMVVAGLGAATGRVINPAVLVARPLTGLRDVTAAVRALPASMMWIVRELPGFGVDAWRLGQLAVMFGRNRVAIIMNYDHIERFASTIRRSDRYQIITQRWGESGAESGDVKVIVRAFRIMGNTNRVEGLDGKNVVDSQIESAVTAVHSGLPLSTVARLTGIPEKILNEWTEVLRRGLDPDALPVRPSPVTPTLGDGWMFRSPDWPRPYVATLSPSEDLAQYPLIVKALRETPFRSLSAALGVGGGELLQSVAKNALQADDQSSGGVGITELATVAQRQKSSLVPASPLLTWMSSLDPQQRRQLIDELVAANVLSVEQIEDVRSERERSVRLHPDIVRLLRRTPPAAWALFLEIAATEWSELSLRQIMAILRAEFEPETRK